MLSATIAIHWHDDSQPVYSLDFQPPTDDVKRLATAGGDKNVRIWKVLYSESGDPQETSIEYLSTLRKHSQAVNAVRFDPSGGLLASAGDDGMLIIWKLADNIIHEFGVLDDEVKESWFARQVHNTNLEIYDICWSPDSKFIATGSMDSTTKVYSISTGQKVTEIGNHNHYVQGIAWDPLNEFIATQSADRSVNVYSLLIERGNSTLSLSARLCSRLIRAEVPSMKVSELLLNNNVNVSKGAMMDHEERQTVFRGHSSDSDNEVSKRVSQGPSPVCAPLTVRLVKKVSHLYHSENLQSFFRRLLFSPDGSLLVAPLGIHKYERSDETTSDGLDRPVSLNTIYLYIRSGFNQTPVCHLPGLPKPAIAVAFNPFRFELSRTNTTSVFSLPYKMIFAVATHDAIILYDTEMLQPLGVLSNLHYLSITDLCWDSNGHDLLVSSAEGFCSVISFEKAAFGSIFEGSDETLNAPKSKKENRDLDETKARSSILPEIVETETLEATYGDFSIPPMS